MCVCVCVSLSLCLSLFILFHYLFVSTVYIFGQSVGLYYGFLYFISKMNWHFSIGRCLLFASTLSLSQKKKKTHPLHSSPGKLCPEQLVKKNDDFVRQINMNRIMHALYCRSMPIHSVLHTSLIYEPTQKNMQNYPSDEPLSFIKAAEAKGIFQNTYFNVYKQKVQLDMCRKKVWLYSNTSWYETSHHCLEGSLIRWRWSAERV